MPVLEFAPFHGARPARAVAAIAAGIVVLTGLLGLVGWSSGLTRLISWTSWSGLEAPNSAMALALCGLSLWLQMPTAISRWRYGAALAIATITALVALATIAEYALGKDLGIDRLVVDVGPSDGTASFPGRPGVGASAGLLLVSISLLMLRTRSFAALCVSSVATSGSLLLALTVMFGYLFRVQDDSFLWTPFGMALQTALCFLALGVGIITARPDRPLIATIISPHAGGAIARVILPVAIGLPILLATIQLAGERAGAVTQAAGIALRVSLFIAIQSAVVLVTAQALNRSDQRRRQAEESRKLMLDELDHRVKNTLASVMAVCEQTLASSSTLAEFRAAFTGRVHAMARAHEALAANRWNGVSVRKLLETTFAPFVTQGSDKIRLGGDETRLAAAAALPVAATLHELATNAAKHGALSGSSDGGIAVEWTTPGDGGLSIRWTETHGARRQAATPPAHSGGFGTTLIRGLVAHELKGSTHLVIDEQGVRCLITVPPGLENSRGPSGAHA